jgi:hypothetical protein
MSQEPSKNGLSYVRARLHRLAESIPKKRFLKTLKIPAQGDTLIPFIFIRNKRRDIPSEGYASLKKTPWYTLSPVWQPATDYNGCLARFKLKTTRQTAITICRGPPGNIAERHREGRKALQTILDLCLLKRYRKEVVTKSFIDNEVWIQGGQESPLMKKKWLNQLHLSTHRKRNTVQYYA